MKRIEPYLLWLGHAGDCRDVNRIVANEIQAVVQLAYEEPPVLLPRELLYFRIPLHDDPSNITFHLRLAVDVVAALLRNQTPTLVCCSAGASRSPAIAAIALAQFEGSSPAACLETIRGVVGTDVSPGLWHQLLSLTPQ